MPCALQKRRCARAPLAKGALLQDSMAKWLDRSSPAAVLEAATLQGSNVYMTISLLVRQQQDVEKRRAQVMHPYTACHSVPDNSGEIPR